MRPSDRSSWHMSGLLAAVAGLLPPSPLAGQTPEAPPPRAKVELNDRNYAQWRKHILPDTGVGLLGSSEDGEVVVRLQFQMLF